MWKRRNKNEIICGSFIHRCNFYKIPFIQNLDKVAFTLMRFQVFNFRDLGLLKLFDMVTNVRN